MASGVGAALRHERVRRNLPLAVIADQTKISERFLDAIERERFDQLPGLLFTRNFVRQYALALELDPEPLLAEIPKVDLADAPLPVAQARARAPRWDPRWNFAISTAGWLVLAVGAGAAAYFHFNRPAPIDHTASIDHTAPVVSGYSRPVEQHAAVEQAVTDQTPALVPEAPHRPVEVLLTARESSWVQVTADGKPAFTATLAPNETRRVSADDQVKVLTGNAGGVAIWLNGKALDPLGPVGQVRTVTLTAAGPQSIPKNPLPQQQPAPL
ncbi:MAG: helix-turn-helix domain-containing protein [Terriglobia bacterium]